MKMFRVKLNVEDAEERHEDAALTEAFRKAVKNSIEEGLKQGIPAPMYDNRSGKSYQLYPDGSKVYADTVAALNEATDTETF